MCNINNYEFYKKKHICVKCGQVNAEKDHTMCLECMMKSRESSLAYTRKHKEELKKKSRVRSKDRYYRLKKLNICTSCGKRKTKNNKVLCNYCASKINYRKRKEYLLNVYATKNMQQIRV